MEVFGAGNGKRFFAEIIQEFPVQRHVMIKHLDGHRRVEIFAQPSVPIFLTPWAVQRHASFRDETSENRLFKNDDGG
jgi:hypothetical protein